MVENYPINGCDTWRTYLTLNVFLPGSAYFYNAGTYVPTYIMPFNCTDTGGTATPGDAWFFDGVFLPEDCLIEYSDWLNQLDIVTTFSWDACECPP